MSKTLIFVPTYNERQNVGPLFAEIVALGLSADVVFMDDGSPDGTGAALDEIAAKDSRLKVIHRPSKSGIGSAHKEGIRWAYDHGYETLVTLDADFTHSPSDIPGLLKKSEEADLAVGSRYLQENSLHDWSFFRKFLTRTAHVLTTVLLGLKYDSTGAFRVYRLNRLPLGFESSVRSNGYSFFFESLYLLHRSGFSIAEQPISLSARAFGNSKMSYTEIYRSLRLLGTLWIEGLVSTPKLLKSAAT